MTNEDLKEALLIVDKLVSHAWHRTPDNLFRCNGCSRFAETPGQIQHAPDCEVEKGYALLAKCKDII